MFEIAVAGNRIQLAKYGNNIAGGDQCPARVTKSHLFCCIYSATFDLSIRYTVWSFLIGGGFYTTAAYSCLQTQAQRYMCVKSTREAQKYEFIMNYNYISVWILESSGWILLCLQSCFYFVLVLDVFSLLNTINVILFELNLLQNLIKWDDCLVDCDLIDRQMFVVISFICNWNIGTISWFDRSIYCWCFKCIFEYNIKWS